MLSKSVYCLRHEEWCRDAVVVYTVGLALSTAVESSSNDVAIGLHSLRLSSSSV